MADLSKICKEVICPVCGSLLEMGSIDWRDNMVRLREQSEFRRVGEEFIFRFRFTCQNCGTTYINKKIKNISIR